MIRMPEGPLKHVGDFPLTVAPHTDVVANITVTVIGDTVAGLIDRARGAAHRAATACPSAPRIANVLGDGAQIRTICVVQHRDGLRWLLPVRH